MSARQRTTAFVTDERYFWHRSEVDFGPWVEGELGFESPEPRRRLLNLLRRSGLLERLRQVEPQALTTDELELVHDREYVGRVRDLSAAGGGETGEYAGIGPGSFEIAALAAGGAATALLAVASGDADTAYALVRPPGHHAERNRGRGYCVFANIALAIRVAQQRGAVARVAVVDIDVHHGNGTEEAFLADPSVLTISIHHDRNYPEDSGFAQVTGVGDGRGTNVNIPLMAGSGEGAYARAMELIVLPALRSFAPEVIVLAAGYDAGGLDPLGRMLLSADAYGRLAGAVLDLADDVCGGRLVVVQEGGYSPLHVPFCGLRVVERISGQQTEVVDPFAWIGDLPDQPVTPTQSDGLEDVRRMLVDGGVRLD